MVEGLRTKLKADADHDILEWSARLLTSGVGDLPHDLQRVPGDLKWCGMPLSDPHVPERTKWQSLPKPQSYCKRPAPQGWLSAVLPDFRPEAHRGGVHSERSSLYGWMEKSSGQPQLLSQAAGLSIGCLRFPMSSTTHQVGRFLWMLAKPALPTSTSTSIASRARTTSIKSC